MKIFFFFLLILTIHVCAAEYQATVISCHDGDTLFVSVSLGLDVVKYEHIRLLGIDAPELKTPEGVKVAAYVEKLLVGKNVTIVTTLDRREKYGRLLAEVFLNKMSVNKMLVKAGMAKPYDGGKRG